MIEIKKAEAKLQEDIRQILKDLYIFSKDNWFSEPVAVYEMIKAICVKNKVGDAEWAKKLVQDEKPPNYSKTLNIGDSQIEIRIYERCREHFPPSGILILSCYYDNQKFEAEVINGPDVYNISDSAFLTGIKTLNSIIHIYKTLRTSSENLPRARKDL